MQKKEYAMHKKALVARAMLVSEEGLQAAIADEMRDGGTLPYLVFDAMAAHLKRKWVSVGSWSGRKLCRK